MTRVRSVSVLLGSGVTLIVLLALSPLYALQTFEKVIRGTARIQDLLYLLAIPLAIMSSCSMMLWNLRKRKSFSIWNIFHKE